MCSIALRALLVVLVTFGFVGSAAAQAACNYDVAGKDYRVIYKNVWPSDIRANIWTRVKGESNWNLMNHNKACNGAYCDAWVISPGRTVTHCVAYAQVKKQRQLKVEMSCDGKLMGKSGWRREVTLPTSSSYFAAASGKLMPEDFVKSICCNPYPVAPAGAAALLVDLDKLIERRCGPKPS